MVTWMGNENHPPVIWKRFSGPLAPLAGRYGSSDLAVLLLRASLDQEVQAGRLADRREQPTESGQLVPTSTLSTVKHP